MSIEGGFQGRTNKLVDGCYSFWQGATFEVVREYELRTGAATAGNATFKIVFAVCFVALLWLFDFGCKVSLWQECVKRLLATV